MTENPAVSDWYSACALGDHTPDWIRDVQTYQLCDARFEQNQRATWFCTREPGHPGRHVAEEDGVVVAIDNPESPAFEVRYRGIVVPPKYYSLDTRPGLAAFICGVDAFADAVPADEYDAWPGDYGACVLRLGVPEPTLPPGKHLHQVNSDSPLRCLASDGSLWGWGYSPDGAREDADMPWEETVSLSGGNYCVRIQDDSQCR